jgi:hypothetical protein
MHITANPGNRCRWQRRKCAHIFIKQMAGTPEKIEGVLFHGLVFEVYKCGLPSFVELFYALSNGMHNRI